MDETVKVYPSNNTTYNFEVQSFKFSGNLEQVNTIISNKRKLKEIQRHIKKKIIIIIWHLCINLFKLSLFYYCYCIYYFKICSRLDIRTGFWEVFSWLSRCIAPHSTPAQFVSELANSHRFTSAAPSFCATRTAPSPDVLRVVWAVQHNAAAAAAEWSAPKPSVVLSPRVLYSSLTKRCPWGSRTAEWTVW